ncbi:MAG: hypothetical protein ACJA13_000716 [Paraglaciecola sp.]
MVNPDQGTPRRVLSYYFLEKNVQNNITISI